MSLADELRQTRGTIINDGNNLSRQQELEAELNNGRAGWYRGVGDEYNAPLWEGRGGYNDTEKSAIIGQDRLDKIDNGGNYSDWGLTPEEEAGMYGDPISRYRYFDQDTALQDQANSANAQRNVVSNMHDELGNSLGSQLGVSGNYFTDVNNALNSSDQAANAAVNKDELSLSKDFADKYKLSPEEQQRIEQVGAQSVRAGAQAQQDAVERAGRAAGVGPLGMAALKSRTERDSAIDAGDALTRGRVAASDTAASRLKDTEGMRLGAAQQYAGLASKLAMDQGDRQIAAKTQGEQMRLGAEQDISNRKMDIAKSTGQLGAQTEANINSQGRQVNQYYTDKGTDIATGIDKDYRSTAKDIANNRQQTARDKSNDQLNRNIYTDTARTQREAGVADTRLQQQQIGLNYLTHQQDQANQNAQNSYGRQTDIYGIKTNGMNTADSNLVKQDQAPKWWERLAGAAAGVGKAFGGFGLGG